MGLFSLLIGVFFAILLLSLTRRAPPLDDGREGQSTEALVTRLVNSLSGDQLLDQPILNRILALGVKGVPAIIDEVKSNRIEDGTIEPERLAMMEELIADFGLAVVPLVCRELVRMPAGSSLTSHLLRIIQRLGSKGALAVIQQSVQEPRLALFVPRLADGIDDRELSLYLTKSPPEELPDHLASLACHVARRASVLDALWAGCDQTRRLVLSRWIREWVPLCRVDDVIRGLNDGDPTVRITAAQVARLVVDARLIPALTKMLEQSPACRLAAVSGLAAQDITLAAAPLERAISDPVPQVAATVLAALTPTPSTVIKRRWRETAAPNDPVWSALTAGLPADHCPVEPLLRAMDERDGPSRSLAIHLLALKSPTDPRARERLIRLAEGVVLDDRIAAVLALARVGDRTAADLLVRTVRVASITTPIVPLQEAAQHIGPALIPVLIRRFRTHNHETAERILTILRCVPCGQASHQLLHVLDDVRTPRLELLLTQTLAAAGSSTRSAIHQILRHQSRGLVMPALRFLAIHAQADDAKLLLHLYDHQRALRTITLSILDCMGRPVLDALEEHIDAGGDDASLLVLEQHYGILAACVGDHQESDV